MKKEFQAGGEWKRSTSHIWDLSMLWIEAILYEYYLIWVWIWCKGSWLQATFVFIVMETRIWIKRQLASKVRRRLASSAAGRVAVQATWRNEWVFVVLRHPSKGCWLLRKHVVDRAKICGMSQTTLNHRLLEKRANKSKTKAFLLCYVVLRHTACPSKACSHLGLALCEVESHEEPGVSRSVRSAATASERAAALLSRLREDSSMRPRWVDLRKPKLGVFECPVQDSCLAPKTRFMSWQVVFSGARCPWRYRMLPWSRAVPSSGVNALSAQLFTALPPWPSTSRSNERHSTPNALTALNGLKRVSDALELLKNASEEDTKRLEALALPISTLVLLQLASDFLKGLEGWKEKG